MNARIETVEEHFKAEYGSGYEEYLKVWLGSHLEPNLPVRYQRLAREVVLRLPWCWKGTETPVLPFLWHVAMGACPDMMDLDFAHCSAMMDDRFSDVACCGMLVDQLARIALYEARRSGIPESVARAMHEEVEELAEVGSTYPEREMMRVMVENLTNEWGFASERDAFWAENGAASRFTREEINFLDAL